MEIIHANMYASNEVEEKRVMMVNPESPSEKVKQHIDKSLDRKIFFLKLMAVGAMLFAAWRISG